jgi:hypothetical protein
LNSREAAGFLWPPGPRVNILTIFNWLPVDRNCPLLPAGQAFVGLVMGKRNFLGTNTKWNDFCMNSASNGTVWFKETFLSRPIEGYLHEP